MEGWILRLRRELQVLQRYLELLIVVLADFHPSISMKRHVYGGCAVYTAYW